MAKYAKWIGGGLGWAFAGPVGGIVGWVIGALMDYSGGDKMVTIEEDSGRAYHLQFDGSLLVMTAAVMRADGRTVKAELEHVRGFLLQNFGEEKTNHYLLTLRDLLKTEFSINQATEEVRQYLSHPARLQLMHFLFGIAFSDDHYDHSEDKILEQIGRQLGVSAADLASIRAMFGNKPKDWYAVLEVSTEATNEEVKKAYRRMSLKYHPDKVHHLGEEVVRGAEEKFRQLNEAYENIKRQRGMV